MARCAPESSTGSTPLHVAWVNVVYSCTLAAGTDALICTGYAEEGHVSCRPCIRRRTARSARLTRRMAWAFEFPYETFRLTVSFN